MGNEVIDRVAKNLAAQEPKSKGLRSAAVSIILRDGESPSVLLIKRAERAGDPWSGQIAFPGGKMQPGDKTAKDTAARETMEEVGVDLEKAAEFLGYADTTTTHTGTMDVVPTVFFLKQEVEVKPNEEVASYRWVNLKDFLSPNGRSTYKFNYDGRNIEMPSYLVEDYVVWGLTHRILTSVLKEPK
ncbi:MAG TPA: CoA pyrophosphatase [Nitrososphaerales archaeon]|nr:CoA pyrophosphatase [Nitrososphaerales archaeon]